MTQEKSGEDEHLKLIQVPNEIRKQSTDIDLDQIVSYQRSARNELILRFLSLLLLSLTFGLVIIQVNILWKSRELLVHDMVARDRRLLSYPRYYQVPHEEETWNWDPDTLLLKVNTSIFVR